MYKMVILNGNQESPKIYVPIKQAEFFATKAWVPVNSTSLYFHLDIRVQIQINSLHLSADKKLYTVRLI